MLIIIYFIINPIKYIWSNINAIYSNINDDSIEIQVKKYIKAKQHSIVRRIKKKFKKIGVNRNKKIIRNRN